MSVETSVDPWATLDGLLGVYAVQTLSDVVGPVAFYGRCSTEDNQDPETSRAWQVGNAEKFVGPLGGMVVAEYFDIGQSRSVPWDRRTEAGRLMAALKNPNRGWHAMVGGEARGAGSATSSRSSRHVSPRMASTCGCPSWAAGSIRSTHRTRC